MSDAATYAGPARPLTPSEHNAIGLVGWATGLLGLLGFANSFARVQAAATPCFGWLAWTVPLGIDLGIAVFSALDIALARLDLRLSWLRLIPWTLTAATVYLNIAGEPTLFGQVAHAVLPCLWVIAIEVGAHTIRIRAGLASHTRMDRIRRSRWLLAFWPTAALWRRMVLWEIRSYPQALSRERDRLLALTELQDRYGRFAWRWKAPRRVRALYKLGELVPATVMDQDWPRTVGAGSGGADRDEHRQDRASSQHSPSRPHGTQKSIADATRGHSTSRPRPVPDVDDLMPLGWRIAAELENAGQPLNRHNLQEALRAEGLPTSNARAGALLTRLRSEAPTEPGPGPADTANRSPVPTKAVPGTRGRAPTPGPRTRTAPTATVAPAKGPTADFTASSAPSTHPRGDTRP